LANPAERSDAGTKCNFELFRRKDLNRGETSPQGYSLGANYCAVMLHFLCQFRINCAVGAAS